MQETQFWTFGILGGLLTASIVVGGCVLPVAEGVVMPQAPARLSATYRMTIDAGNAAVVEVSGFSTAMPSVDPAGFAASRIYPALRVSMQVLGLDMPHPQTFTYELLHAADGRLVHASLRCRDPATTNCATDGPRATVIPDLFDAPGFLGAGPFLGQRLVVGTSIEISHWDPTGDATVRWDVEHFDAPADDNCVRLSSSKPVTAKTHVPVAPMWGILVLCASSPLPMRIEQGPIVLELEQLEADSSFAADPLPSPPVTAIRSCRAELPPHNNVTLPSAAYMNWAMRSDEHVREWLRTHPGAIQLPSYGRQSVQTPTSAIGLMLLEEHEVGGILALVDPGGVVEARFASEVWRSTPLGQESEMQPSYAAGHLGPLKAGAPPTTCVAPAPNFEDEAERLIAMTGFAVDSYYAAVAPDVAAYWQGFQLPAEPFRQEEPLAVRETLHPAPWPARTYVQLMPTTNGAVAYYAGIAADASTGWVRWMETRQT